MPSPDGFAHAEIRPIDPSGRAVQVLFNPTEYTFARSVNWNLENIRSRDVSDNDFSGGMPTTLSMQLFFDSYEERKDVREYTEPIWKMTLIDKKAEHKVTKLGRPPLVQFVWGNLWSFKAVITSIQLRFTMFLPNGTPVRATMDVTFQQIEETGLYPRQNPTSGGGPEVRRHVVRPRETLAGIAYQEYRDPNHWRTIADANGLENPMVLTPGQELLIPDLDEMA